MHDVNSRSSDDGSTPIDLQTAIALIEAGEAHPNICVDLGEGHYARADGRLGLQGLLQRLRGHRLIQSLANAQTPSDIVSMRSGEIEIDPEVAVILAALRG